MEKQSVSKRKINKFFFYLDDYEITYSSSRDMIIIKNYQTRQVYNFSISGFVLRYHKHLQQDNDSSTMHANKILNVFSYILKKRKIVCDFFTQSWLIECFLFLFCQTFPNISKDFNLSVKDCLRFLYTKLVD